MMKCPYCRKTLREHERYCDFCEQDLTDFVEGKVKPKKKVEVKKAPIQKKIVKPVKKIMAYCVKCKKKVPVKNPKDYTMKNKRKAIKGICPVCSCKVFRIVGMKNKSKK